VRGFPDHYPPTTDISPAEIIPKFINLLQRKKPLWIHGSGNNFRCYLYAGDAADAFDTILHKGEIGQVYNVDSQNEISNLDLAAKLLTTFGVDDVEGNVQHTRDRPFNDFRYKVDGKKIASLGWAPKVSFEEGLKETVEWYGRFSNWWGPIEGILSPFPVVKTESGGEVVAEGFEKMVGLQTSGGAGGNAVAGVEMKVEVGANKENELKMEDVGGVDRDAAEAIKLKNGVMKCTNSAGDHARKRKADVMDAVF
jgi:dTDP-glucose 4,6-dehydratase